MRLISSIFFNPALLDLLVILAVLNLGANLVHWFRLVEVDLARVSEVTAMGFVIAILYTAVWERKKSQS